MKRGKIFLLSISSVFLACFFWLLGVNFVEATNHYSFSYTCLKESDGSECGNEYTGAFYFRLDSINIEAGFSDEDIIIPDTYNDGVHSGNGDIKKIASHVFNVDASIDSVTIGTLTLPVGTSEIASEAFNGANASKIASIGSVTITSRVVTIGNKLFYDNGDTTTPAYTNVDFIYLTHTEYSDGTPIPVSIASGAFDSRGIERVVCSNLSVLNYYNALVDNNDLLTIKYTFNFYTYENEERTDISGVKYFYLKSDGYIDIDDVPSNLTVSGFIFNGWRLKISGDYIDLGKTPDASNYVPVSIFKDDINDYLGKIYPSFTLQDVTYNFIAKDRDGYAINLASPLVYDGSTGKATELVNLNISSVSHMLKNVPGFNLTTVWKKNDEAFVNVGNTYSFSEVSYNGVYSVTISGAYTYGDKEYTSIVTKTLTINISKAPLYLTINDVTKTYGTYITASDVHPSLIGNLESASMVEYTFNLPTTYNYRNAGTYVNAVKLNSLSIIAGEGADRRDRSANYNIYSDSGDFIVSPFTIDAYYTEDESFAYGEEIIIQKLFSNTIYNVNENVTVNFHKNGSKNVGTYALNAASSTNPNYNIVFNATLSTGQVTITPKEVEIGYELDNAIYDGNAKDVFVYYTDVNGVRIGVPYTIVNYANTRYYGDKIPTKFLDAGTYTISVDALEDTNYTLINPNAQCKKELTIIIGKYTSNIATDLNYNSIQTFYYSGQVINPNVRINNDEQVATFSCSIGVVSATCKDVGSYSVLTYYAETINYNATQVTLTLTIQPLQVNISPKNFEVNYGESINLREEMIINGERVLVVYNTNATSSSPVGGYNITGVSIKKIDNYSDYNNYHGSIVLSEGTNKVKVVKRPVTIVYYNYENLYYNGKAKSIGAYAVDDLSNKVLDDIDLEVVSDEGEIKSAKTYHLHAHLTSDYYYVENNGSLTFDVNKAKYDLSNIKFNDAKFILDFKKHSITIDGKLPEGVNVVYTIDGKEGNATSKAFSHTVVAKFVGDSDNYIDIPELTATIYIDMSWVFITIVSAIMLAGAIIGTMILYSRYRREHPRKIKLKIRSIANEDLAAKRVAKSVEEVLGKSQEEEVEVEPLESEDDLLENATDTFIERIYAADSEVKYYYSEVKNELLSYEGISHTVDRKYEVFYHGTRQIAKLSICNKVLRLYVNLDPDKYDKSQYNQRDMSNFECHAHTPLRINVNTIESLRNAKIFIRILRKKENLKAIGSFVRIDYEKFYTLKEKTLPKFFKKMFNSSKQNKKDN